MGRRKFPRVVPPPVTVVRDPVLRPRLLWRLSRAEKRALHEKQVGMLEGQEEGRAVIPEEVLEAAVTLGQGCQAEARQLRSLAVCGPAVLQLELTSAVCQYFVEKRPELVPPFGRPGRI